MKKKSLIINKENRTVKFKDNEKEFEISFIDADTEIEQLTLQHSRYIVKLRLTADEVIYE